MRIQYRPIVPIASAILLSLLLLPAPPAAAQESSDEDCMACHEGLGKQFATNIHARIAGFEIKGFAAGCQSCHGDGKAHMDSGDPEQIKSFSDDSRPEENNEVCIQCHRSKALNEWEGSPHETAGIGCIDCHKIHDDPLLVTTPVPRSDSYPIARPDVKPVARHVERCFDCHVDVQAQFNYPSRHPVREGHMSCGSCHNPHGTWLGTLKGEESPAQLCMSCHTQYQGPFVFEHEPVAEGCETCHSPHGSVANNLLVQNEPFVCLQCHEFHFHAGLEGEEDDEVYIPAYDPDVGLATGRGDPDFGPREPRVFRTAVPNPNREQGYKSAFATKCTQCHTMVHGTDNPSQTVPGEGQGLMR